MRKLAATLLLLTLFITAQAQQKYIDSLKQQLSKAKEDTNKVNILGSFGNIYKWSYPDSALLYITPGLQLAKKLNFVRGQIILMNAAVEAFGTKGNYSRALQLGFEMQRLAESQKESWMLPTALWSIGNSYYYSGDYKNALVYYYKLKSNKKIFRLAQGLFSGFIGETYFHLNNLDSAFAYTWTAYQLDKRAKFYWTVPYFYLGKIYARKGNIPLAINYLRTGINFSSENLEKTDGYIDLATIYKNNGNPDSAIFYARSALSIGLKSSIPLPVMNAGKILSDIYRSRNLSDSAFKYQDIMLSAKDSVFSKEKITRMQNFSFDEQMRQQEILAKQEEYRNNVKMYVLLAAITVFILIAVILWHNNRQKQAANAKIQKALAELKATQTQLVQREKMASLGELTAGIAHEIQNPLNFVNNFSDVNREMLGELEEELKAGNTDEALAIASDIRQNEEKINHHGKRADFIVKGMLQHSRTSTGERQLTDINVLANEFLKLSFQGLRAKDKSFNAEMVTHFDDNLPKPNIVQQDIGRVLLNLFNNAFYAVNQKMKTAAPDYKPTVEVSTFVSPLASGGWGLSVKDNGNGIPDAIKDKIMQPFFTTKPTGEGTGLGLSLSYDIVVKGHGGSINVDTKEGEFTEFIINLPI